MPVIEYGCIVWNPSDQSTISRIESIQRTFTNRIQGMEDSNYWEHLCKLNIYIYSLERRCDRYIILHVFQIIYGDVPNPGLAWHINGSRGRLLLLATIVGKSKYGYKLKCTCFVYTTCLLFNSLPIYLRNFDGNMVSLKLKLDKFLITVPDQTRNGGYSLYSQATSNIKVQFAHV